MLRSHWIGAGAAVVVELSPCRFCWLLCWPDGLGNLVAYFHWKWDSAVHAALLLMVPWQVAFGLSIATLVPLAFMLVAELEYVSGYWGWLWTRYWYPLGLLGATTVLTVFFGFYQVSRVLSLGDVGRRVQVLDQSLKEGKGGDPELVDALKRESSGQFES